jgi:cytochrome P450
VPSFTPAQIERWRDPMREVAEQLVGEFKADGECEFVGQFASRYPAELFARIAGIPLEDVPTYRRLVDDVGLAWQRPLAPVRQRAEQAIDGLFGYVGELIEKRQRDLGDDLISQLIRAEAEGDRLSFGELRGVMVLLIFAAHDNTRNQLTMIVRELTDHPEVWRRLPDDPALAVNVVNEGMRLHPVIQDLFRVASTDVVHRDVSFAPETAIQIPAAAANRDPAVFPEPDRFRPERANAASQLSFGAGHHYCLGANLARADMAEALQVLARSLPRVRLLEYRESEARATGRRPELLRLGFETDAGAKAARTAAGASA